jgi:glutamyl/glutaminyl-tRNA synthetase
VRSRPGIAIAGPACAGSARTTTTARSDPVLTRFAPAPTGYLHLGHVANAIWTWGWARSVGAQVLLRIEDHDQQRSRPAFAAAILDDLDWLGFQADLGPARQSDPDAAAAYDAALERLRAEDRVYGCDCTRSTFAAWSREQGRPWIGPGCPGDCRDRGRDGPVLRAFIGSGSEAWTDLLLGARDAMVAPSGDPPVRDRHGNWTYALCVVVDDLRQGVDLVVRGRDLLDATASQIRLARLLGRSAPPNFAHHPLILRPDGSKLSKSAGDSGVRELRHAGVTPADVRARAGAASGAEPAQWSVG